MVLPCLAPRHHAPSALAQILASPSFDGATVCATVTDSSGTILFDQNGATRVAPASNEKLFSAAFALYELGLDYTPTTKIWVTPTHLVVDTTGDPSLSHDDLAKARAQLNLDRRLPVWVNQPYDPEIPDGWEVGDLPNRYAAPVAAFSVDQSGFELWNENGKPVLKPEAYGVAIKTGSRTGMPKFAYDPIRRVVSVSGKFPTKKERLDTLAVPNATQAAASVIGKGVVPVFDDPDGEPTLTLKGQTLDQILTRCLQHSDNNMAENLLLMGGAHVAKLDPVDPYAQALHALTDFETRVVGLPESDLSPRDGSGLTRANLVTTHAISTLLNWERSQTTFPQWKAALASPGVGTLVSRLKGVDFHGKTGSLSHVTALSGYLVTSGGRSLTVSIVANGYKCRDSQAHAVIDKFVEFLSQNGA